MAFLAGGETVVHLRGRGRWAGAIKKLRFLLLAGLPVFPTWRSSLLEVTGRMDRPMLLVATLTVRRQPVFWKPVFSIPDVLERNDAYHALEKSDGLLVTGPTGTNVNDLSVLLIG